MADYDIITIGGGVGGAAIAKAMAERGYRVLVAERDREFKDRVRGEYIAPWGVAEAKALGLYDALVEAGGHHTPSFVTHVQPAPPMPRNLAEETPQKVHPMGIYHPEMQERLLAAAAAAGAEVRRGSRVTNVQPGAEPKVTVESGDATLTLTARLVVAADGRNSMARKWGGFTAREEPPRHYLAGVLLEGSGADQGASLIVFNPMQNKCAYLFPQGGRRVRAYFGSLVEDGIRLQGDGDFARFVEESIAVGAPKEAYEGATQAGPLATFDGTESWVEHPYQSGIALIGDAAGTSDQTWGQGVSLTLRDARGLRDALLADEDWDRAGHAYASTYASRFLECRKAEETFADVLLARTPEAVERRMKVFSLLMSGHAQLPGTLEAGPELAAISDEEMATLFGNS